VSLRDVSWSGGVVRGGEETPDTCDLRLLEKRIIEGNGFFCESYLGVKATEVALTSSLNS